MNHGVLDVARAASAGLATLSESLRGAVVEVRSDHGIGTGIIWGGGGLVVTNAHCAPRGVSLTIGTGGTWREAGVVAYHAVHDLALLAAPRASGPLLEIRDVDSLRPGELVFAYGHPNGMPNALAMGVVHGIVRDRRTTEARWIVADVGLAPGNSGGPLVDAEGRLVGVNCMVVNGLGAALPATLVRRFVERTLEQRAA